MKTRFVLALAMILVLFVAGSVPLASADPVVPFRASFNCRIQVVGVENDFCLMHVLHCDGQGTHLGEKVKFYTSDTRTCFDGSQHGGMTLTADNGDHLFGDFVGNHAGFPGTVTFGGEFRITGGDGRLAGVTGEGEYWGTAEGEAGLLYFGGKLTK